METRRLAYFIKIIDSGSISRAALHLKMAQPALSQQLAILEREVGAKLLTRSVQGVLPTQAGQSLYNHGQILLRHLEQAQGEVKALAGASAVPVTVGLPLSTAFLLSLPLVRAVRQRSTNIRLRLIEDVSGSLISMMRDNRIDLAVLFDNAETSEFFMEPLWNEEIFLIVPPSFASGDTVSLEDVAALDLVFPIAGNGSRMALEVAFARLGLQPRIVAEVNSVPTLKAAVAAKVGATVLPWPAVHEDVLSGRLRAIRIVDGELTRNVSLCAARGFPQTSPIRAVAQLIREVAAQQTEQHHSHGMRIIKAVR